MMDSAMNEEDYRWALELGSWLEKSTEDQLYRDALANVVRLVGQRTISANIRNWCLTKALELEGSQTVVKPTFNVFITMNHGYAGRDAG